MEKRTEGTSRLIRGTLIKMVPAASLNTLLVCVMFMIDMMLAGSMLGMEAISAVAIASPGTSLFIALSTAVMHGTGLRVIWAKGRADHEGFRRAFNGGLTLAIEVGLVFAVVILVFARPLVFLFGGANSTAEVSDLAFLYLRWCAPMIFLTFVNGVLGETISNLGYQVERAVMTVVNIASNAGFSYLFMRLLPDDIMIAGLGMGTTASTLVQILISIIILRVRRVNILFKPVFLKLREIGDILRCGVPTAVDSVVESLMSAIINNLILIGFPEEPLILSIVSVVTNIRNIIGCAPRGTAGAAAPLFGIFYSERDKASLLRTMVQAIVLGIPFTIIWCVICRLLLPFLTKLYGMELTPELLQGIRFVMWFMPARLFLFLFISFYEATERFGSSLMLGVIPDSVLYPLMLAVLIPAFGKTGLWLSLSTEILLGLIILLPVMMLMSRKNPTPADRLLRLRPHILERSPCFEYSVEGSEESAVGVSEQLQNFLLENGTSARTALLAALCTEELAVDMVNDLRAHPQKQSSDGRILDIRVFNDDGTAEILIRSLGRAYDPLDMDTAPDPVAKLGVRMVQKLAETVTYTYVYKLNIVSIVLDGGAKAQSDF